MRHFYFLLFDIVARGSNFAEAIWFGNVLQAVVLCVHLGTGIWHKARLASGPVSLGPVSVNQL